MSKQYISFGTSAGICNRIKRFFSALRFEIDKNEPLDFYWSRGDLTNRGFYELFEFKPYAVNEIFCTTKIHDAEKREVGTTNVWRLLVEDNELPKGFTKAFKKDKEDKEYIDFEYERIPVSVREEYLKYFKELKPSKCVRERMENGIEMPNHCVGVHIRIGRFWNEFGRGNRDGVEYYIEEMKKFSDDTLFFLASADETISARINQEFPGRIIELKNKSYTDSIDAVAELYLLGCTDTLIATYGSTFSEVAWWLGECKQKVVVVGEHDWKLKCPVCCNEDIERIKEYPRTNILQMYNHLYWDVPEDLEAADYRICRCKNCKLVFSDPMLGGSQNFYTWVTAHPNYYPTKETPRWEWGKIRDYIIKHNISSVLEVGSGTGEFLDYVKLQSETRMVGLDTTIESFEKCKAKGHEVYAMPLERYILTSKEKYDLVVAFHLLEHVDNPLELVKDMMKLVNSNGRCMLSFPYSAVDVETCFTTANNMPPHHMTRWSLSAIEALAKEVNANYELVAPYSQSVKSEIYSDLRNEYFPIYKENVTRLQVIWEAIKHYGRTREIINSEKGKEDILLAEEIGGKAIVRRPPWFVLMILTKK